MKFYWGTRNTRHLLNLWLWNTLTTSISWRYRLPIHNFVVIIVFLFFSII